MDRGEASLQSIDNHPIDADVAAEGEALAESKRQARAAALAAKGEDPRFGDGSMAVQEGSLVEA